MMQPSRQRAPFPARQSYVDLASAVSPYAPASAAGYPGVGVGGGLPGGASGSSSSAGGLPNGHGHAHGAGPGAGYRFGEGGGVDGHGHGLSGSGGAGPPIWGLTREASSGGTSDAATAGPTASGVGHLRTPYRDSRATPEFPSAGHLPSVPHPRAEHDRIPHAHAHAHGHTSARRPSLAYRSPSPAQARGGLAFALPFGLQLPLVPSAGTIRFVLLCSLWYTTSALSSNTGKVILNNFRFPVTLTIVQFFFVAGYCWLSSRPWMAWVARGARTRLREPTRRIVWNTLPMAVFQVGGHIFSSMAISRVPVSTVHTIKALSPLFTVCAYAFLFRVSYTFATYLSLLPLTLGVMLACSFDMSASNAFGLICAFGSTLVFVSSNIVFKKLMPSGSAGGSGGGGGGGAGGEGRLDKINLLYYSSGMAFLLMVPIWLSSDAGTLLALWWAPESVQTTRSGTASPLTVAFYLLANGTVHFAQNYLAFAILSSTSPVTYSIASLVKRIAVICLAIVWFSQAVHPVQALGIGLTGVGLWMYNNAKRDVERGEKKVRQIEAVKGGMLPLTQADRKLLDGSREPTPAHDDKMDVHASPRPMYMPDDVMPQSMSSAIKSNGFALPPPSYPFPDSSRGNAQSQTLAPSSAPAGPNVHMTMSISEPYPSPPPSNASSPPFTSMVISPTEAKSQGHARRRSSIERDHTKFTPGKPAAVHAVHHNLPQVPASPDSKAD